MNDDRIDDLINAWLDDAATDAQHAQLERTLLTSEAARERFWQLATLHGLTAEVASLRWGIPQSAQAAGDSQPPIAPDAAAGAPGAAAGGSSPAGSQLPMTPLAVAADWLSLQFRSPRALAAVVLVGLATYFGSLLFSIVWQRAWQAPGQQAAAPAGAQQAEIAQSPPLYGAARLLFANDCKWQQGSAAPVVGQALEPCRLHLLRGTAEIEFATGARVRITGPTEFDLKSAGLGYLIEGRLAARVPPRGRGFTIDTPSARLVDLGTAFVVEVSRATTRMAVIEGAVNVLPAQPTGKPAGFHRLTLGQAMIISRGESGAVTASSEPFDSQWVDQNPPPGDWLPLEQAAAPRDPYYLRMIDTPGLVAYWRLDERGGQFARDEIGRDTRPGGLAPGVYHNMRASDFRRPGPQSTDSTAIGFDGTNYIEMRDRNGRLTGDWNGVTVTAWIQPRDTGASDFRVIAGTWAMIVSQDQFVLGQEGEKIAFCVADGKVAEHTAPSSSKWPLVPGKWAFVAGTWDKATRALHLYVNGQDDTPAGATQIGDGLNQNSITSFCIGSQLGDRRFFLGSIDEVAVFKRCLTAREIAQLYATAAPRDFEKPAAKKDRP